MTLSTQSVPGDLSPSKESGTETALQSAVRKMGNSSGVIIPKPFLAEIGAKAGDVVDIMVESGRIVIAPLPSSTWAITVCPSFCTTLRPPGPARQSSSSKPANCIVMVDAPRVRVFHALPHAAAETALQSTPLCS